MSSQDRKLAKLSMREHIKPQEITLNKIRHGEVVILCVLIGFRGSIATITRSGSFPTGTRDRVHHGAHAGGRQRVKGKIVFSIDFRVRARKRDSTNKNLERKG